MKKLPSVSLFRALLLFVAIGIGSRALAMTIVPSFDSTITSAPNAASIENAINYSTTSIGNLFANPGTVNILFQLSNSNQFLGSSSSTSYATTYSSYTNLLKSASTANASNRTLSTAVANLSQGNDANGALKVLATSALLRVGLGQSSATATSDGTITLSSAFPISYTRPVAAYNGSNTSYDAVRVIEHEVGEVLGGGGAGSILNADSTTQSKYVGPLDLYRYSATGTPSLTTSATATSYFSIDGGATSIAKFNQSSSGDYGDWAPSSPACPGLVQDAFACNNAQADVTSTSPEFYMLSAMGYTAAGISWNCATNPDGTSYSGTSAAQKTGSCVQVVTGNNTFTGATSITAGTLQIGNGGASGSIIGDVANNGALAFNRSDGWIYSGQISGSGAVQQIGVGVTYLTGNSSYTGGTTISAGTLVLGTGGTSGSIIGSVVNNGTLGLNRSDGIVFGGIISGSGAVQQTGAGVTYLTGNNSFTGGTTISRGTLVIGQGQASGFITGDVLDNGTLGFDRSDGIVFSGVIGGSGAVQQTGTGVVYLTGNSTYAGGTTISRGTLVVGQGQATGFITGDVVNNGTLGLNRSDGITFAGVISGSGALQQTGTGVTYLTGNSFFTGGTTISRGTLVVGQGQASGTIVGDVLDNGTLGLNRSDGITFSGNISGAGSFQQMGTGVTYLTGNSSYTGGTAISRGALIMGLGGTTGTIVGDVVDYGVFGLNRSDGITFAGAISGPGSVQQTGTGVTYLTGNSSYTGGTAISRGTLMIGQGSSSGTIIGNVEDYGTLGFNRSDSAAFSGTISGAGTIQQSGTGTIYLTGNNSYSGGTYLARGTIQVSNNNALGTGDVTYAGAGANLQLDNNISLFNNVNISNSAVVTVNGSDVGALAGALVGSADLLKNGTGTLILYHDNRATYSGNISYHGTLIAGATGAFGTGTVTNLGSNLVILDGVTFGNAVNLVDTLTIAQNGGTGIMSGVINQTGGPWNVIKTGAGTITLSAANTYTGGTAVNAGALNVTGRIGAVAVAGGATLSGTGTVGSTAVAAGGTMAPGAAGTGTLTVQGNLTLASGATYVAGLAPTAATLTSVTGTAALGGALVANAAPGTYAVGQRYTLLSAAGGVTGTFSSLNIGGLPGYLKGRTVYDAGNAYLVVDPNALTPLLAAGASRNQVAIAASIDTAVANGAAAAAFSPLFAASGTALGGSLNQLSAEIVSDAAQSASLSMASYFDMLTSRGNAADLSGVAPGQSFGAPDGPKPAQHAPGELHVWGAGLGGHLSVSADPVSGASRLSSGYGGGAIGLDVGLDDVSQLGASLAYTHESFTSGTVGNGHGNAVTLAVYGRRQIFGRGYVAAAMGYGWDSIRTARTVSVAGIDVLAGDFSAHAFGGRIEGGYSTDLADGLSLVPYGALAVQSIAAPAFAETARSGNSSFALAYGDNSANTTTGEFGARLEALLGQAVILSGRAAWSHNFQQTLSVTSSFQALANSSFTVSGPGQATDAAILGTELGYHSSDRISLDLNLNGRFADSSTALWANAKIAYHW